MSYATERQAIETYFETEWAAATPIGFDHQKFTPVENSVRLTIQSGQALQKSFAAPGANRVQHVGVAMFQIFVAGGEGSAAWRAYADTIEGLFMNKKIAADGTVATSAAEVLVEFGKTGEMPYVLSVLQDPPFTIATINAPFVREENKA